MRTKMTATIVPLDGKYYGTRVCIKGENEVQSTIEIWHHDSSGPSCRELELWGHTIEDWENNVQVDDGWGGKISIREYIFDSHYETKSSYEIATRIVESFENV